MGAICLKWVGNLAVKLTEKQKKFIDYYIELGNATEAAIGAGYSEKTAKQIGCENLTKLDQHIKAKLEAKQDERIASQDEVLFYLTSVMRNQLKEEVVVVEGSGGGESQATTIEKDVNIKDRNKAAELLAKRYGLLTDKINLTGNMDFNIKIDYGDSNAD